MWNYLARPFLRGMGHRLAFTLACCATPLAISSAHADDTAPLTQLSIEDLMDIDVSLVSRRPEPRSNAAAAVYVITREEIERSPALTVPELLRYVPGVNVARIDASKWSITIRGFSGQIANKLQVLIDGRSIFTAVFSGVPWEDHFMPLDLIERIEVIRGPGGATWGANAVNGIINIITRDAAAHSGNQLTLSAGTELESAATFIHGGKLRGDTHYRAYLHQIGMRNSAEVDGGPAEDDWRGLMGGLRWDGVYGDDSLMLQLDGMVDRLHDAYEAPLSPRHPDGFLDSLSRTQRVVTLGRWTRSLSDTSELQVQASYQHYEYESILLGEWRNIGTLDFQHRFEAGARHEIMWGLGANYYEDHETATQNAALYPARRRQRLFSFFAQDQIRWRDGAIALTLGARLEYTDQDGVNLLPSARLAWTPGNGDTTWWAALSRAVNIPSRAELGSRLDVAQLGPFALGMAGQEDYGSEKLVALEAGVRTRLGENLLLDATVFHNDYDDFRILRLGLPRFDSRSRRPALLFPLIPENNAGALARGVEVTLDWQPTEHWRTRLGWSLLEVQVNSHRPGYDPITPAVPDDTPAHQLFWQHYFTIARNLTLDIGARYHSGMKSLDMGDHLSMDARLAWSPRDDLTIEVAGQNLFDDGDPEYNTSILSTAVTGTQRGVYGSVTWKF